MTHVAPTLHSTQNRTSNLHCGDAVVDGVAFDGVEAGAVDHFDDLFLSIYFAAGFDGVAVDDPSATQPG